MLGKRGNQAVMKIILITCQHIGKTLDIIFQLLNYSLAKTSIKICCSVSWSQRSKK